MLKTEKCKSNESYFIHSQNLKKLYNTKCWQGRETDSPHTAGGDVNWLNHFGRKKKSLPTVKTEHVPLDSVFPLQYYVNMPTCVEDGNLILSKQNRGKQPKCLLSAS